MEPRRNDNRTFKAHTLKVHRDQCRNQLNSERFILQTSARVTDVASMGAHRPFVEKCH